MSVARSAFLPSLSFDYFYGIDANQFAVYNRNHQRNLGSAAQAQLNIPVWNWGATRSKLRQAELHLQQAKVDLSFTQRQLLANLNSFYREAEVASSQLRFAGTFARPGCREPAADAAALQGGRGDGAGSGGRADHAGPGAQRVRRWAGAISCRAGGTSDLDGEFLVHEQNKSSGICGVPDRACRLLRSKRRRKPSPSCRCK